MLVVSTWAIIAPEGIAGIRKVIGQDFGQNYLPEVPRKYTAKAKNAQEAHEAIRPTDVTRTPEAMARELDGAQLRLYELIWKRAVASQMAAAELNRAAELGAALAAGVALGVF